MRHESLLFKACVPDVIARKDSYHASRVQIFILRRSLQFASISTQLAIISCIDITRSLKHNIFCLDSACSPYNSSEGLQQDLCMQSVTRSSAVGILGAENHESYRQFCRYRLSRFHVHTQYQLRTFLTSTCRPVYSAICQSRRHLVVHLI